MTSPALEPDPEPNPPLAGELRVAEPEPEPEPRRRKRTRLRHYVLVRHRHNWGLLFKFSLVGGTGFIVNLAAFMLVLQVGGAPGGVYYDLPSTEFNVRNYHVYSTLAFLVANVSNFLLNRVWTFDSRGASHWVSEYAPFLMIGVVAQAIGLLLLTALVHPSLGDLPVLPAQAITIVLVTPVSFVGNKLWTFRAVRGNHRSA